MIKFRQICKADIDDVISLLQRGFPDHKRDYWTSAIRRLDHHATPANYPKYGYVIDDDGTLVGVLLTIFTHVEDRGVRCNVSSWYVEPAYRAYGALLSQRATRNPEVAFFNVTPAPHTWSMVQSHGFVPFATGSTLAIPFLSRSISARVIPITDAADIPADHLPQAEVALLRDHLHYGCICLVCVHEKNYYPFVFLPRKYGFVRIANLIYARSMNQFVRFAGVIGRFLLLKRIVLVKFSSDGPTRGIVGYHADNRPKFRKGADDRIGSADTAYCEQVMFGR